MSNINDGGPAFPSEQGHTPDGRWNQTYEYGMSIRDYFAAKAVVGLLSDSSIQAPASEFANRAYEVADAMMKARES